MKRFIYTAGATGLMQVATLVIMTKLAPDERIAPLRERRLPPVTQLGMLSLALVLAAGIYLSAHLPEHVSLAPAEALLGASALVLAGNLLALSRVLGFPGGASSRWPGGRCSPTR